MKNKELVLGNLNINDLKEISLEDFFRNINKS